MIFGRMGRRYTNLGSTIHMDCSPCYSTDQTRKAKKGNRWREPSTNCLPHQNQDNKGTDETGAYPNKCPPCGAGVLNKEGYDPNYREGCNKDWDRFVGINPKVQILHDEFHRCNFGALSW